MSLSLILLKTDYRKLLAIDLIMTGQNQYDLEMTFALICKANCSAEPASTLRSAKHAVSLCYQKDCLLALCLAQSFLKRFSYD